MEAQALRMSRRAFLRAGAAAPLSGLPLAAWFQDALAGAAEGVSPELLFLRRFSYGIRPADWDSIRQLGVAEYLERQLTQSDAPTPAISWAVKHHCAIAGVMITASHNAPRYNGVKLKGAFGGSALPEQCRRVEVYINDNERQGRGPNLMDFKKAREAGLIQKFNPLPAYFDHLRTLINTDIIADNPQRFVVDAMYGSGRGVIKSFLQGTGCEIAEIRGEMNPGFGSVHPEPIAKYLGALASAVVLGAVSFVLPPWYMARTSIFPPEPTMALPMYAEVMQQLSARTDDGDPHYADTCAWTNSAVVSSTRS